ncbi:hypothetical protein EYC54_00230 [Xanthomonas oryzae]|nr:hypothetical protein EYC54_00230 [Xanthomonas oryzae]
MSGGRGRRAHNRSGRGVHADSEHRPRPPGGERSRFVSRSYGPSWLAYDMAGIQRFGMHAAEGTVAKLQAILGRPLRPHADVVREATARA